MTAGTAIAETVVWQFCQTFLGLTPLERWGATRQLSTNFMSEGWFIVMGGAVLAVLVVLLVWVSYNGAVERRRRRASVDSFAENASRRGLSVRERQILLAVAENSGLKRGDGIFTMEDAFERGVAKLVEQSRVQQGPESSDRLIDELTFLSEKLGFGKQARGPAGTKVTSKQIPVGKQVRLTRRAAGMAQFIRATVIENDSMELTVRLEVQVKVTFGEIWRVRYYFGASVWEFDTSVISYDGAVLVLKHSSSVRFINRRRFVRVPVRNLAFISQFPFARMLSLKGVEKNMGSDAGSSFAKALRDSWAPLEFVHAVVTELAGPGLRVEAPLDVKVGERVLVIFKLDRDDEGAQEDAERVTSRIIEDIGEVRRSEPTEDGFSIAIELVGLTDSDISELIRATNTASAKASSKNKAETASAGGEQEAQADADVEESMTAQGA